jgi:nucleoside recognition membrane protein YjiH
MEGNMKTDLRTSPRRTSRELLRFLVPSLIGLAIFTLPIPKDGTVTIIIGILVDLLRAVLQDYLPLIGMVLVVLSGAFTLFCVAVKPTYVKNNDFLRGLFIVGPVWYISRALGAVLYVMVYYQLGPEFIWSPDTGGTPVFILIPILVALFIFTSFVISLLTDFGLMEYFGTLLRRVMRPLFTLPGRAAIDCLASWLGSPSVAVIITRRMYDDGYYTGREAGIIATTFSLVSIGYIYVMAEVVGLPHKYFQLLFATYVVSLILAFLMPRIWPLSKLPDTYNVHTGKRIKEYEELEEKKVTLHQWAVQTAVDRAKTSGVKSFWESGWKTLLTIYVSTLPLVMAWGTIALVIAFYTPLFQWAAYPFSLMLQLIGIPEAAETGTAFVLALPDQFLAGIVGAGVESNIAKFMSAGISITGLIYLSEVGVLILDSKIPIKFWDLIVIYLIRAILSIFLLAPFAFWLA